VFTFQVRAAPLVEGGSYPAAPLPPGPPRSPSTASDQR